MIEPNSHCGFCGAAFAPEQPWPRTCYACSNKTYRNPTPVAVTLIPVDENRLLLVRRNIEPQKGKLALPGGYIGLGETWQEAGAREVLEETGVVLDAAQIRLFDARSAGNTILIFGLAPGITAVEVPTGTPPGDETQEIVAGAMPGASGEAEEWAGLAFPLHTEVAWRFWLSHPPLSLE